MSTNISNLSVASASISNLTDMTNYAIEMTGVSKTYKAKRALEGLSLKIQKNEIFGLLGHNGAGKTTTVSILTTLIRPDSGSVNVAGIDVMKAPSLVRSKIGYLPESVQLYNKLTTRENLRFFGELSGLRNPDSDIDRVLEYLEFTDNADKRVGEFSKGMRQRVGIAQAILHQPEVLFLDEPTSGLDPEGVWQLREVIKRLNADLGMTIFMNTHLLSEVTKTCTSIGILRSGQLAYTNSIDAVTQEFPDEQAVENLYLSLEAQSK
jgi:ABC-2 type transport system ATP-binding protein